MANLVSNYMKGQMIWYGGLPQGGSPDRLVLVLLLAQGLPSDAVIEDTFMLGDLLAAGAQEHPSGGRKALDYTNGIIAGFNNDPAVDRVYFTFDPVTWTSLAASGALGALIVCYSDDGSTTNAGNLRVMTKHDLSVTPNGSDLTITPAATGIGQAV